MGNEPDWRKNFKSPPSNALKNHLANQRIAGNYQKIDGAEDLVANSLKLANEHLYLYAAANADKQHMANLRAELDAGFKSEDGALLTRYTIRKPDSAGNTLPTYAGLQVVGFGPTRMEVLDKLQRGDTKEQDCISIGEAQYCDPRASSTIAPATTCTIENPTGQAQKKPAEWRALPEGRNTGYSSTLWAKLMPIKQINPSNDPGGLFIFRATIQEDYLWVTKQEWGAIKRAWE